MAEEELAPKEGTEPVDAPAVDVAFDGNAAVEAQQTEPLTVEALAAEEGWVAKDQYTGDPEKWRPADEYLRVGKQAIRSMSRDLKATREEVSRIARTSGELTANITAEKVAERDRYWQGIQAKAVEEGDQETVNRAVDERLKLKTEAPAPVEGEPRETLAWKDKHSTWFGKDRVATGRALQVAEMSRQQGATVEEQLQDAERAVKREFPDLFPARAKTPAGVQTGQARNANKSSAKKSFADMPAESQAMAKDYLARHGIPLEKTAESYWDDQAKNGRKVG